MNRTFKALSALLSYPGAELQAAIGDIRRTLAGQVPAASALEPLLERLESGGLYDIQTRYVDLFDRTPKLSLYLFEHVHGDSRARGQAMVDLLDLYRRHGLEPDSRELPDHLPLFLEFLALIPPAEARNLLAETVHILTALGRRLEEKGSDYAAVFQVLTALAETPASPEAVAALRDLPDATPELLDQHWEEAPVTFGPGCERGNERTILFDRRKR